MRFIERMARIYETKLWYPVVLKSLRWISQPVSCAALDIVSRKVQAFRPGREWRPAIRKCIFAATLCCGSLHLFADTVIALREMARVMKPAAILEWSRKRHGLHVFDPFRDGTVLDRLRLP